ncbi:MAG: hypothetical protein ABJM11_06650 [Marinobacter sp.]|uniref:hypothetical protein n=1 Tax=Marinobacter sp. TaxID=50741 RepID=UPI0032980559
MSLRDSLQARFRRFSEEILPEGLGSVSEKIEHLRKRLDHMNCSLAERALPENRRLRVRELSLSRKAEQAGQKVTKIREKI